MFVDESEFPVFPSILLRVNGRSEEGRFRLIDLDHTLIVGAKKSFDQMKSILQVVHLLIVLLQIRLQMLKEFASGLGNAFVVRQVFDLTSFSIGPISSSSSASASVWPCPWDFV